MKTEERITKLRKMSRTYREDETKSPLKLDKTWNYGMGRQSFVEVIEKEKKVLYNLMLTKQKDLQNIRKAFEGYTLIGVDKPYYSHETLKNVYQKEEKTREACRILETIKRICPQEDKEEFVLLTDRQLERETGITATPSSIKRIINNLDINTAEAQIQIKDGMICIRENGRSDERMICHLNKKGREWTKECYVNTFRADMIDKRFFTKKQFK